MLRRALWVAILVTAAHSAVAAVPLQVTEMGRLLDASSQPVSGTVSLKFSVYDVATGGTALWTEMQSIALDNGYFVVQLGSVTSFPTDLWNGSKRFLGVTVNTDSEMAPRETLVSVPYALQAGDVTGDLHAASLTIAGVPVVDTGGNLLLGAQGPTGPKGATGPAGGNGG